MNKKAKRARHHTTCLHTMSNRLSDSQLAKLYRFCKRLRNRTELPFFRKRRWHCS